MKEIILGDCRLILGDCLEVMESLPDESVDICITSPPYNLGIDYEGQNDYLELDDYYNWCELWLMRIFNLLKDGGRLCLNHYLSCGTARRRFAPLMKLNEIAESIGYLHHGLAIWNDITLTKRTAWGSWLSASAPYINSPYEGILILYKGVWNIGRGKSDIEKDEFIESCSGVWNIPTERNREHPAPFPVSLPKRCMKLLSFVGSTVLDPFMGSGTTGVACVQTNRKFIGIEIEPKYFDIAVKRIEEAQQQLNLPI